jgi:hypothetical protein
MKTYREWRYSITIFASALHGGEWSVSRTSHFTCGDKDPGTHWVDPRTDLDAVEGIKIKKKKK